MKQFIEPIIAIGIKPHYLKWESHLVRKLNTIAIIGMFNMTAGIALFWYFDYPDFILDCFIAFFAFPVVFILNKYTNYIWTSYWFFIWGFLFFTSLSLKMGKDSMMLLFYFPLIIAIVQLLGRKEMLKHLIIISLLCLASIAVILYGYTKSGNQSIVTIGNINTLSIINILISISTTIAFTISITFESISQENEIKKMLLEKDVLLAEVFHRVKNNMNIVTSLLNLKKNMSESLEVKEALEDCRNRVFSMALVHNNIFNSNNVVGLNFKDYIQNLVDEIRNSHGNSENDEIILVTENINLDLANAIPCGLILNELITNSYKYGHVENQKLQIQIIFYLEDGCIKLVVKDNGPGLKNLDFSISNSLGIDLIKSLSEQINGTYSFHNENGLVFRLEFTETV
jgi:two-component sensor histidine kinase